MSNGVDTLVKLIQKACNNGNFDQSQLPFLREYAFSLNISSEELNKLINAGIQSSTTNLQPGGELTNSSGFITSNQQGSGFISGSELIVQNTAVSNSEFSEFNQMQTNGAMSDIYTALHLGQRKVIIKRIKKEYQNNPQYINLFYKEFENIFQLEHQHIVRVYGKGHDTEGPFYYMEYIDGRTITHLLKNENLRNNKKQIYLLAIQILDALDYIHKKQIFHRDLKPDNILVTFKGDNVKLIDFGLAAADDQTDNLIKAGTPQYSAPEVLTKATNASQRSDIYSFGILFLEIFTGYTNPNAIKNINDTLFSKIIDKCLQTNPANRYASCSDILLELNRETKNKTVPDWLSLKVRDFATDGVITKNERKVLELDALNCGVDKQVLDALINLEIEKANIQIKKQYKPENIVHDGSPYLRNKQVQKPVNQKRRGINWLIVIVIAIITLLAIANYNNLKQFVLKNTLFSQTKPGNTVMYTAVGAVPFRELASENAQIIKNLPKGFAVEIIESGYFWSRVKIDKKEGYILNKHLTNN